MVHSRAAFLFIFIRGVDSRSASVETGDYRAAGTSLAPLSEPGPGAWSCDIPLSNVATASVWRLRLKLVFIMTRAANDPSVFTITEKSV